jgi:hypothetical protein
MYCLRPLSVLQHPNTAACFGSPHKLSLKIRHLCFQSLVLCTVCSSVSIRLFCACTVCSSVLIVSSFLHTACRSCFVGLVSACPHARNVSHVPTLTLPVVCVVDSPKKQRIRSVLHKILVPEPLSMYTNTRDWPETRAHTRNKRAHTHENTLAARVHI